MILSRICWRFVGPEIAYMLCPLMRFQTRVLVYKIAQADWHQDPVLE